MTPAEVIAMRDKLHRDLPAWVKASDPTKKVADQLIRTGWVTAPPKNEGESKWVRPSGMPLKRR